MDTFLQYLLSIEEFMDEKRGSLLLEKAFRRVDQHRREKAAGMRPGRGQAASLGAGLLIQLALEEMRDLSGQQDVGPGGKDDFCCKLKQHTVTSLLAQLESRDFFPVSYRYGDNGKPYFKDYPYYFSISHSGDYVLCVISQKDIGADIQQWRKCDIKRLAGRFFSDLEKEALMQADLFFRLWARKEAYGKLTGKGVGYAAGINLLPEKEVVPEGRKLFWTENEFCPEKQLYIENPLRMETQLCSEEYSISGYNIAICQYNDNDVFL